MVQGQRVGIKRETMSVTNPRFTGRKHSAESNKKRSETLKKLYAEGAANFGFKTKYANEDERRDAVARNRRKSRYGITEVMYRKMIDIQNNECLICSAPAAVIDHDHKTNEVRGILCAGCNRGLGAFKDSAESLMRAAAYLRADNKLAVKNIQYFVTKEGIVYAEA